MSRMIFDFKCDNCSHVEEQFLDSRLTISSCSLCGSTSTRQIGAPRIALDGTDPGFPDAYDKWARQHEKAGKRH